MSVSYPFQKSTFPDRLKEEVIANSSLAAKFESINGGSGVTNVVFTSALDSTEKSDLATIVNAHVAQPTTKQQMRAYLDQVIFPFIDDLIADMAADNIANGITQAGKTGHVLGLHCKPYDVNNNGFPLSLWATFDSGSLYESIKVLQYIRDNPTEYDGLSPFITDAKLHEIINKIQAKLGQPLT